MATQTNQKTNTGRITQIVGVVIDVEFDGGVPAIYNALEIPKADGTKVVLEVAQHLSSKSVRAISLGSTDGLRRDMEVTDTGAPISVPIGKDTLGRMFNVVGEPIDGKPNKF